MERTKPLQANRKETQLFKEICCRANLLPFQSLIYAISYARLSARAPKGSRATSCRQKLLVHLNTLRVLAKLLQSSVEIDSTLSYMNMKSAVSNYVSLFYAMDGKERRGYIDMASAHVVDGIRPENNLLLVPALMASSGKPKHSAITGIEIALYKKPFRLLYDASTAALQVMRLRQRIALEHSSEECTAEFSGSLTKLDSRIKSIEYGIINPESDERAKRDFILDAIEFSTSHGAVALDAVAERLGTVSVRSDKMRRLVRKAHH